MTHRERVMDSYSWLSILCGLALVAAVAASRWPLDRWHPVFILMVVANYIVIWFAAAATISVLVWSITSNEGPSMLSVILAALVPTLLLSGLFCWMHARDKPH
jgi:hypothetical protein